MRILMITGALPVPERPGSTAFVARQIESVQAAGAMVDVLEIKGTRRLKYMSALSRLRELISSSDILHAHYGYCGWVARTQLRKPVVISFMGDDLLGTPDRSGRATLSSRLGVQMNRLVARSVDAVIVKSAEMARVVAPVKAHIVPNGVDMQAFRPMDPTLARTSLGWSEDKHYVLFPGSPDIPRKGYSLARAAVTAASARLATELQLVSLWGIAPERVPLYMNACAALLMTSLWEGSPNVVKEALACNTPVVSVPVGDVPELLSGVDGCEVCSRDVDSLGRALARVVSEDQHSAGRAALRRRGLDLESVAESIMRIYAQVLERSPRRGCHA